jgi:hypothetical protein
MTKRLAMALAGVFLALTSGPAQADDILARYSLLAHDPIKNRTMLLVRAVVDGEATACPTVTIDGTATSMATRHNPDSARFPITVCEAVAPLTSDVRLADDAMATMKDYEGGDLRVVMFGDSGCKGGTKQDCATAWPFAGIAAEAAADPPDLVLHVGDWD